MSSWSRSVCTAGALILAGISVFGTEHRARTQPFLANHGAEPHLVWLVKIGTWMAAMLTLVVLIAAVMILGLMFAGTRSFPIFSWLRASVSEVMAITLGHLALGFTVAVLCGMVIRRGITAWLVTVIFWILLAFPLVGLTRST